MSRDEKHLGQGRIIACSPTPRCCCFGQRCAAFTVSLPSFNLAAQQCVGSDRQQACACWFAQPKHCAGGTTRTLGTERIMSNRVASLVRSLAEEAKKEWPLTRQTISRCYYSWLPDPPNEKPSTSELWIDDIWERSKGIPKKLFQAACTSEMKLGELGKTLCP